MKTSRIYFICLTLLATIAIVFIQCAPNKTENAATTSTNEGDQIMRGKSLVDFGGCHDCHSPKVMTANGPEPDTTKMLSGHPAEMGIPQFDASLLGPGKFIMGTQDLTAWAGPWGISFPFNLTPDSATGLGGWTEETFVKTMRTGKHMGAAAGRPILPPMPWWTLNTLSDADLKAIFAYLRTIPAISNKVPDPVPFEEIGKKM